MHTIAYKYKAGPALYIGISINTYDISVYIGIRAKAPHIPLYDDGQYRVAAAVPICPTHPVTYRVTLARTHTAVLFYLKQS
jgi:hypothetical protein